MKPNKTILHHTASSRDKTTVDDIERWHKKRWPGFISELGYHIGYHFVITGDGKYVQTRKETEIGAHDRPNKGKIGIALTGNFEIEKPSSVQLATLRFLLKKLQEDHSIPRSQVLGHNQTSPTLCPGNNLMPFIDAWRKYSPAEPKLSAIARMLERIRKIIEQLKRSLNQSNK